MIAANLNQHDIQSNHGMSANARSVMFIAQLRLSEGKRNSTKVLKWAFWRSCKGLGRARVRIGKKKGLTRGPISSAGSGPNQNPSRKSSVDDNNSFQEKGSDIFNSGLLVSDTEVKPKLPFLNNPKTYAYMAPENNISTIKLVTDPLCNTNFTAWRFKIQNVLAYQNLDDDILSDTEDMKKKEHYSACKKLATTFI
ncbi:uncharacterized protein VP01_3594g4 [Puccinia sorghi]|uniref:Uncharacterized protein n=1 Tax=Puccinia sorghi TaxID=27349 RepID=A0A0L6UV54_9BASI|nr:uncharacterized protein VP01_3594g4 [Puccinia sorghi]